MAGSSIPTLAAQLLENGTAVARAEIRLVRARVSMRLAAAKYGAILLAVAAVVALLGLIGLIVGLVMSLARLVDPAIAGAIVLAAALVVAAVIGWIGVRSLRPSSPADTGS